jgi:hypothetical protein
MRTYIIAAMAARSSVLGLDVLGLLAMRGVPQLYRNGELVVVLDCSDLARSARFWPGVLGLTAGRVTGGPYRSLVPEAARASRCCCSRCPAASARRTGCVLQPPGEGQPTA